MSESPIRDLLLKIRYDTTAIQAKVTDLLNLVDALHIEGRAESPIDRAIAKARAGIDAEWWQLEDLMLEVELDMLGIPQVDRPPLYRQAQRRREKADMSVTE